MGGKHSFIITYTISVEQKARKLLNENIYVMWITVYGMESEWNYNFICICRKIILLHNSNYNVKKVEI